MKNNVEITDDLVYRYLAGEASPEEAIGINAWLTAGDNMARYMEIKATWDATHPGKRSHIINKEAAWHALESRIAATSSPAKIQTTHLPRSLVLRVAASLVLILTSLILVYLFRTNKTTKEVAIDSGALVRSTSLPDGSVVTLYHNSSLAYPQQFPETERRIRLTHGEAFFNITPDATRPFVIHTSMADIRVTGTSFNVVLAEDKVVVAVNEGKVIVYNTRDSVTLDAGFTATMVRNEDVFRVARSVDPNDWGYATGRLTFGNTRLSEVINDLEKTYSCKIILKNSAIAGCKLTASFEDDSAQNILHLIAETLNLSVSQNGSVFTLEGEGCR